MLATRHSSVVSVHIPQKGGTRPTPGVAGSSADILSYMDVDLSTDLSHVSQLVGAVEEGAHLAIGSRLAKDSKVTRSLKREVISRSLQRPDQDDVLHPLPDAQCGFKAITRQAAQAIIPQVENNNWFFDTEMLIIAAKSGYRIREIPVR